ncbi:9284_t:CDS:2 [Funneliformis geosporum]|nr:9284_t:CDS:2 [Funneliformis geosporum]
MNASEKKDTPQPKIIHEGVKMHDSDTAIAAEPLLDQHSDSPQQPLQNDNIILANPLVPNLLCSPYQPPGSESQSQHDSQENYLISQQYNTLLEQPSFEQYTLFYPSYNYHNYPYMNNVFYITHHWILYEITYLPPPQSFEFGLA